MPLALQIRNLTGDLTVVEAEKGWTIRRVKDAVELESKVGWWEQRLCAGGEELLDDERLGAALRAAGVDTSVDSVDLCLFRTHLDRGKWLDLLQKKPMMMSEAPEPILKDPEFVLAAMRSDVWSLAYADRSLRSHLAFAFEAVQQNGLALRHMVPELREDRDLVLAAVQVDGHAIKYAGVALTADPTVVMAAFQQNSQSLLHVDPTVLADSAFVLEALRHSHHILQHVPEETRRQPEVAGLALHLYGGHADVQELLSAPLRGEGLEDEDQLWCSADEARELQERGEALFLDCRDEDEFAVSHIEGALPLRATDLVKMLNVDKFPAFEKITEEASKTLVVYSDNGLDVSRCKLVALALRASKQVDSKRVHRLVDGMNAWKRAGYQVYGDPREYYRKHPIT